MIIIKQDTVMTTARPWTGKIQALKWCLEAALHRCSEDMQKIYRRTPMPKYDFNKVALQLNLNQTSTCVVSCKFAV